MKTANVADMVALAQALVDSPNALSVLIAVLSERMNKVEQDVRDIKRGRP